MPLPISSTEGPETAQEERGGDEEKHNEQVKKPFPASPRMQVFLSEAAQAKGRGKALSWKRDSTGATGPFNTGE